MLPMALPLLSGVAGFVPKALLETLGDIFVGDLKQKAFDHLNSRLDAQRGRTAGSQLALAVMKQVADAQNPATPGTVAQRIAIGTALANGTALQYVQAGERLLALNLAQNELERVRGTAAEPAARVAREAAEEAFERANINIGRVASGKAPQPQ